MIGKLSLRVSFCLMTGCSTQQHFGADIPYRQSCSSPLSVLAVTPAISIPSDTCSECHCKDGFARRLTSHGLECKRCDPGHQPKQDRERGCDSCELYPGTVSPAGLQCAPCSAGKKPSSEKDVCLRCPANQYFSTYSHTCRPCPPGTQLNSGAPAGEECSACDEVSAGDGRDVFDVSVWAAGHT